MRKIRIISQIVFVLLFYILFIVSRYPFEHQTGLEFILRFSPLAPLFFVAGEKTFPVFLFAGLVILFTTIFLGRFFCGWICPLGSSLDAFSMVFVHRKKGIKRDLSLKKVKYLLLAGLIVLATAGIHLWGILDPLSVFTRINVVLIYPFFTGIFQSIFINLEKLVGLQALIYPVHDLFKSLIMPEDQFVSLHVWGIFILMLVIFGLEYLERRFWCRYICPAGALLGIMSKFRLYERYVKESCTECNLCQRNCKMGAIPGNDVYRTSKLECIECFDCGDRCPPKVSAIEYGWKWKPYTTSPDISRRQFLGTLGVSVGILGGFKIARSEPQKNALLIRPPGVEDERDFLKKCIRCMACVRICASNGKCLQPAGLEYGLEAFWTPVAHMRIGYCEFNCNLCMEVCPTEAIPKLSLKEKQKYIMGMAYFDKNLCIPYIENRDCIVCEEHCPVPDKAIKFQLKEVILPDQSIKKIRLPYVDYQLCIGCGICEEKCPLEGKPGIFVLRKDAVRLKKDPADLYG
jgi:polyferredoxin/Pyruvate/2-oxoacid:ferredoxin oxidoreductase delta subunit